MLIYIDNLNKVEYKDLQKWLESFIDKYKYDIYEREMTIVNIDGDILRNKITLMIDHTNTTRMYLYINGKCLYSEYFKEDKFVDLDKRFLRLLAKLKNKDRKDE